MNTAASRPTLRNALAAERPLVTPLAHDALSARLIAGAGFRAFAIGGSAMLAARFGLPDIGLIGLADMVAGIRDIAAATALPFFADGDDGYGDVKSVARTVETYEALGVGGILIEDQQREHKQQRADKAHGVVEREVIEQKLRVALAVRRSPETLIIGRTDAYGVSGLDEAIRRAERFLALGVDGVFVAGLKAMEDYERVGRELRGAILSSAVFETPGMPWPAPVELAALGFAQVSYPASLIFRATAVMRDALAQLRRHAEGSAPMAPDPAAAQARQALDDALEVDRWQDVERRFALPGRTDPRT
ncbi:MAG TPA: isocitrate lyase/PEP mutase family protein [Casimicrobiaceae bacterium]|nr:isocitrate lyase/PEP mutase family protein [Casimicrobiaceae bacterium]